MRHLIGFIRDRISVAILGCVAAAIVLACHDSTPPTAARTARSSQDGPLFTPGSGLTNIVLVRANAGVIKVHSNYNDFKGKLSTDENADIVVNNNLMAAGGTSGWHTHSGITIVAIKAGALTLYDGDDPLCQAKTYSAGQVFVEEGGHVHIARNEGPVGAEWYTTYVVPTGGPTRVDAPAPGNCPF